MTDFARGRGPFPLTHSSARNRPGIVKPSKPRPPTFNKCRRVTRVSWKPQQANEWMQSLMTDNLIRYTDIRPSQRKDKIGESGKRRKRRIFATCGFSHFEQSQSDC